jgi:branched-chain amino acid transport system permease protein
VIVGGLDSALGAVLAGLLLGVLEVLTAGYVNALLGPLGKNFHTVLPYLVMIAFLVVRPYGLFGTTKVERL